MQSRFFTSISKAARFTVLAAVFLAPLLWAQFYLVPQYGQPTQELALLHRGMQQSAGRRLVVLGDSTARALAPIDELSIQGNSDIVSIALSGSSMPDWHFTLRRFLEKPNSARVAVIAMVQPSSLLATRLAYSYSPLLMTYREIWEYFRRGALNAESALRMFHYRRFPLLAERAGILARVVAETAPPLGQLMADIYQKEVVPRSTSLPAAQFPPDYFLREILALAREKGIELFFVRSPQHSRVRALPAFAGESEIFRKYCSEHALRCGDLSAAMEDSHFWPDGFHLLPHQMYRYRNRVDNLLIQEKLIKEWFDE